MFQGLDTCSHVKVLHTKHETKGDTGKYFYFDESDFEAMVGYNDWSSKKFDVNQKGSLTWSGSVIVWKADSDNAAHGRRDQGALNNQWVTGDILEICKAGRFQLNLNCIQEPDLHIPVFKILDN